MSELLDTVDETKEPLSLVQCLEAFNRKERYWLIRNALGDPNQALSLSSDFRNRLEALLRLSIPQNAWWAIDYHIDSLFGAFVCDRLQGELQSPLPNPAMPTKPGELPNRLIRGSNEDFDLVITFDRTVVLIEAKGLTAWGNQQIASKCNRMWQWAQLADQVTPVNDSQKAIEVYMVLTSPRRPKKLTALSWPDFVKQNNGSPFFMPLNLSSAPDSFLVPERCDINKTTSQTGEHWHMRQAARPNLDAS